MQDTTYIVYHPGTFGRLLCFILDKFSGNEKFKKIHDPFDSYSRVHGIKGYSGKFTPIHPDSSHNIKNKKVSIPLPELKFDNIQIPEPLTKSPEDIAMEQRFNDLLKKSQEEKIKNENSGIGYLVGGSKVYD